MDILGSGSDIMQHSWLRAITAMLAWPAAAMGADPSPITTDVNLVTAIDVSGSIDGHAERLELLGMAEALEHPAVLQAIAGGQYRRIGFVAFTWSSAGGEFIELVPWTVIASREQAARAARALRTAHNLPARFYAEPWRSPKRRPWVPGLATDISTTIEHGIELLQAAPFASLRRVINICANGRDNVGIGPDLARDRAAAAGIDINAVVLKQEKDLVRYFWEHVRTGAGAFVVEARELPDLTQAMLQKFVAEIAWLWPEP
jgi:Ca-activated chloride channel family protein